MHNKAVYILYVMDNIFISTKIWMTLRTNEAILSTNKFTI